MPNSENGEKPKRKGGRKAEITPQQRVFIENYMKRMDATAAAKAAGYSQKSAGYIGWELLKKPLIAAEIAKRSENKTKKADITADRILQELAAVAFGRITDVVAVKGSRVLVKDTSDWGEEARSAVAEIKETINNEGGTIGLKMHNKVKSLELLMKYKGMIDRKSKDDGENLAGESQETIDQRLSAILSGV
jgi:phage terminase small subunit